MNDCVLVVGNPLNSSYGTVTVTKSWHCLHAKPFVSEAALSENQYTQLRPASKNLIESLRSTATTIQLTTEPAVKPPQ